MLVVHNPNVQLLAKQLEQAQKDGIYVIQINMVSNYKTDAYIGPDYVSLGAQIGADIVKACGAGTGKSGKVQVLQGELTSAVSQDFIKGYSPVFTKDGTVKVVSEQAANWDTTKAHDITATVVQQNPDLCAVFGFWDVMTMGSAQAIKQAGLTDKVKVFVPGDGARAGCDGVASGAFTNYYSFDARGQGRDIITTAKLLLEAGRPAGSTHQALYSPVTLYTKDNMQPNDCFDVKSAKKGT